MEERVAKLVLSKSSTSGSSTLRATLPTKWIRDMGLGEEERFVKLSYDEESKKIIIEKGEEYPIDDTYGLMED